MDEIEQLIDADDWEAARSLIEARLLQEPGSHWLLARLALTYYEQRQYEKALEISNHALSLAPECPLALWEFGGALDMLGRWEEAERVYSGLIARGVDHVAYGDCGEGLDWAMSLFADCEYRRASCFAKSGEPNQAKEALARYQDYIAAGVESIYDAVDTERLSAKICGYAD